MLVVGTYDAAGKPNVMMTSWGGVCSSQPPCVAVSLRKATCEPRHRRRANGDDAAKASAEPVTSHGGATRWGTTIQTAFDGTQTV